MNGAEIYTDVFLLFLASLVGGIVGGAVGAVLSRPRQVQTNRKPFAFPRRSAKVIPFPKRPA